MPRKPETDPIAAQFIAVIRKEMQRRQLSINAVAELVGIPRQTASALLNHPSSVLTSTMIRWFDALELSLELKVSRAK